MQPVAELTLSPAQRAESSTMPDAAALAAILADILPATEAPLVLRGLCRHWPLTQAGLQSPAAALALLQKYSAGLPVTACYLPPETRGRVFYNADFSGFNYQGGPLPFADLCQRLLDPALAHSGASIYMGSTEVSQYFPGIREQHQLPLDCLLNGGPGAAQALVSIWLGSKSRIAAHYDFPHNLACNLVGQRRFTLFPPEQVVNLYPGPMEFAPGGQDVSLVDFAAPDFDRFPRFAQALDAGLQVTLEPGDVLFMPSMWWHHVEALDALNLLLTHWWRDTPAYLGRPNNALLNAMLSIRHLPKAQRKAWQALFDYYIFADEPAGGAELPDAAQGLLRQPLDEATARALRSLIIQKLQR
jgi:hypothetical protein